MAGDWKTTIFTSNKGVSTGCCVVNSQVTLSLYYPTNRNLSVSCGLTTTVKKLIKSGWRLGDHNFHKQQRHFYRMLCGKLTSYIITVLTNKQESVSLMWPDNHSKDADKKWLETGRSQLSQATKAFLQDVVW